MKKFFMCFLALFAASAAFAKTINLSTVQPGSDGFTIAVKNGDVLTGTLASDSKISIADGATVTLANVTINGVRDNKYKWAGLTCLGDCKIILEGSNTVKGFHESYPGIYVSEGKTLTIDGSGSLDASSNGDGAGIGCGNSLPCGNIVLDGGVITATGAGAAGIGAGLDASVGDIVVNGGIVSATGGTDAAGIGGGPGVGNCGNIFINGGSVSALGGSDGAGIGGGYGSVCGDIAIADGVTELIATKGENAPYSIGRGELGLVGFVTIGGTVSGSIAISPFVYPAEFSSYTVVFDKNGGVGTMDNESVYIGFEQRLNANTYTCEGALFAGWNTKQNGEGTAFVDGGFVPSNFAEANAVVKLYAQWWDGDLSKLQHDYVARDGDVLYGTLDGSLQPYKISIADGATVKLNGVVINGVDNKNFDWAGISCLGDCKIILVDGSENIVKGFYKQAPGIYIPKGKTLTIEGKGSLDASSNGSGAGIGGGIYYPYLLAGSIVIKDGLITTSTGIGLGSGEITISGGTVNATSGKGAAIGGSGRNTGLCDKVKIEGGSVTATGLRSVGIGNCKNVVINGGSITATGDGNYAGIGTSENIEINDGLVIATGGESGGAGIGSCGSDYRNGDITINGGEVIATGGEGGAGIGSDKTYNGSVRAHNSSYTGGNITIKGGVVTATGGKGAAGIGSGDSFESGNITIEGGTVIATSGSGFGVKVSAIGGSQVASSGDIVINDGHVTATGAGRVTATGATGAYVGIGGNFANIEINGGTVVAEGWVGIGCAASSCGNITISGGSVRATGEHEAAIGSGANSSSGDIVIRGGDVVATSHDDGPAIGAGGYSVKSSCGNILIEGGTVTALVDGSYYCSSIGSCYEGSTGNITITEGVTRVTATKGHIARYSIGGSGYFGSLPFTKVGTIIIGGVVTEGVSISPFTYPNIPYTVSFDGNGGEGTMASQTLYLGKADQMLNLNAFTRKGFMFAGWNTKADGSGTAYADCAPLMEFESGSSTTLYAQWYEYDGDDVDLSKLKQDYVAHDGDVLRGTLDGSIHPYKISIADGATVTLDGARILGVYDYDNAMIYPWAGLTCLGDCHIVLAENSENSVTGFHHLYPSIYVPEGKTLTIDGKGFLEAAANGYRTAVIGCAGDYSSCGNVVVNDGVITVNGNGDGFSYSDGACIGSGRKGVSGNIEINGGIISVSKCGTSFGAGEKGSAGSVTIGGVETGSINIRPVTIPYSVIFDANGGSGTMDRMWFGYDWKSKNLTKNGFERDGYTFLGWNTKADGSGDSYSEGALIQAQIGEPLTLYALWGEDISSTSGDIVVADGDVLTGSTGNTVTIPDGASVVLSNATVNGGIICQGDATITLVGKNVVKGKESMAGIQVGPSSKTLTIRGNGSLDATGGTEGAGIGLGYINASGQITGASDFQDDGGNIIIEGGVIEATGGENAAGIGMGAISSKAGHSVKMGSIRIKGGTVTAKGYSGIGKGFDFRNMLTIESVIIDHGVKVVDASDINVDYVCMYRDNNETCNSSDYFVVTESGTSRKIQSLFSVVKGYWITTGMGKVEAVVAAANGKAYADETVTLIATPDFGYKVDFFIVNDAAHNDVKVTDGKFTMPLGDVTVGASFVSKYPAIAFDDNGKTATINGNYKGKEAFVIENDIQVENVVLDRSLSTIGYATIMLPFGIDSAKVKGAKQFLRFIGVILNKETNLREVHFERAWCDLPALLADIDKLDNLSDEEKKEKKEKVEAKCNAAPKKLSAYTPYVVQMKNNLLTFDGGVTLVKTPATVDTVVGNWVFRGTLAPKVWEEGDPEIGNAYGYIAGTGEFRKVGDKSSIGALRSYLVYEKQPSGTQSSANVPAGASTIRANFSTEFLPANMDVVIVDDDENGKEHRTVIGKFNTHTGEFKFLTPESGSFDVKGRRVNETRSVGKGRKAKGVYSGRGR